MQHGRPSPRTEALGDADARDVLAAFPFAVLVLDADSRIAYVNAAAEQFFGRGAGALVGGRLDRLLPARSPLLALVAQAAAEGASIAEHDASFLRGDGEDRDLTITVAPVGEAPGRVAVSLHGRSVARRIGDQLAHRQAARSVSGLAALLAHEVKNPLSGIRGAAQLLESSLPDLEDRRLTRMICEETDRICGLVDRMEAFSGEGLARAAVNIHEVLERVRRVAEAGFGRRVRFVEDYDPSLPPVHGDSDRLVQAFLNIVKNACEAAPADGGVVRIGTAYRHGVALALPGGGRRARLPLAVSVSDNGPGLPEEVSGHLFDPFVTTKANGSGLGLALVAKVVGDHGGVVEFDSGAAGAEFRVRLPVLREAGAGTGRAP